MGAGEGLWPGEPVPLGATLGEGGTNFAVFSAGAAAVDLCLFAAGGGEERIPLQEVDGGIWHGFVPGAGAGQRYGYRVDGPWDLSTGDRFNPSKLLLDPYALAVEGDVEWGHGDGDEALFDRRFADNSRSTLDSAPLMPRGVVVDRGFRWSDSGFRRRDLADTVIYECHVKGATRLHPGVPQSLRGTYAGLAHPAFVEHLLALGVTAVELMPVHQFVSERELLLQGKSNYWGYNTIGFFAPHNAYSSSGQAGQQVTEFKVMVDALHAAGLEVILDVVFNHTAEGGQLGPTFSFRGFGNGSYYLVEPGGAIENQAGTGNEINPWDPAALQLIMDSLRYWAGDMHVDGFRFDLATILSQTDSSHSVSVFLYLVGQDPLLAGVKLIAEPWDLSRWQVGRFPPRWSEWNDRFRNGVRMAWQSAPGLLPDFRELFEGSPGLFRPTEGNNPTGSVNYAACHDGYTLRDLVSYNDAGQGAWDSGGPPDSTDTTVLMYRANRQRAMLATVALAQGVPMVCHGDEMGRTQRGNNNCYDEDNEISWVDWEGADLDLLAFARRVFALRAAHPVFRLRRWTTGSTPAVPDQPLEWFDPSGKEISGPGWDAWTSVTLSVHLDGGAIPFPGPRGERIVGDSFLLMINAWWEPLDMTVPARLGGGWRVEVDCSRPRGEPAGEAGGAGVGGVAGVAGVAGGESLRVAPRSMLILRRPAAG